jgi:glycosyltransferase involved in cell wall biosynthesis
LWRERGFDVANVLWVSVETPDRNGQGGQRRQFHQIVALIGRGHHVTVLVPKSKQDDQSLRRFTRVLRPRVAIRGRILKRAVDRLRRTIALPEWDAIVVSHHESGWLMPRGGVAPTPVLLDVHNVMSAWHRAAGRKDDAQVALEQEASAVRGATAISTCSSTELRRLIAMHPDAASKSFAAPLGVDPLEWPAETFRRAEPIVALFGSWGWHPNTLGLAWFMNEVWSLVRDQVADAVVLVAGSGVEGEASWPAGARFVGRVDDLARFAADATVIAVPVLEGVGASVKFAEALASGGSVIATPDGANAFDDPPAFVSAESAEWAQWIIERLQHRSEEPAPAHSRSVALTELTWDAAVAPIHDWLGSVVPVR